MKQLDRTSYEIIKRFCEPLFGRKIFALKTIFRGSLHSINPFIHVIFIKKLVEILEIGNATNFYNFFFLYLSYILFYELLSWVTHKWGWYEAVPEYISYIVENYAGRYIHLDNNETEKIGTGKTISILEKGIDRWGTSAEQFLYFGGGFVITLLISFLMILNISLFAGFIFLLVYILTFFINFILNKKMLSYRYKRIQQMNLFSKRLVRMIMGKIEILQTGKSNQESYALNKYVKKGGYYNLKMAPYFHMFFHLPQFFLIIIKLIFLFIVSQAIFAGDMQISQLVVIFGVMLVLESTIVRFIVFFKDFAKEFTTISRLWDFFDSIPKIQGYDTGKKFKHKLGEIEVKNLSYGYDPKNKVFDDFSLKVPGEQVTAIVGVSGGGKSTLVKLVSGYIRPDEGEIIIDGQKLSEVSLKSYYKDIGYLTQEPSVFDGTVMENLCYALNKKSSKKKLDEIIKMSKCEFIYDFPNGLETEIGEKGIRLSGGQRQRLAIAKIFLKDPKIIILDEPTSALDSFSEEQITIAMHNLFKGRTVIIIAHRLQTVKSADDIILIEDGKIKERGTHASLVRKKGIYKKMLDLQSGF